MKKSKQVMMYLLLLFVATVATCNVAQAADVPDVGIHQSDFVSQGDMESAITITVDGEVEVNTSENQEESFITYSTFATSPEVVENVVQDDPGKSVKSNNKETKEDRRQTRIDLRDSRKKERELSCKNHVPIKLKENKQRSKVSWQKKRINNNRAAVARLTKRNHR